MILVVVPDLANEYAYIQFRDCACIAKKELHAHKMTRMNKSRGQGSHHQHMMKVWKQADRLDRMFEIFGIGIGLGSLAGIVPM